jgi:rod shape determining protein RodA
VEYQEAYLKRQLLNIVIGLIIGTVVAVVDNRLLRAYAPILYVASCLGLLIVLTPLGATVNGSHSWIALGGGFEVQPSEFAKLAMVVLLAMILGEPREGGVGPGARDVLIAMALTAIPAVLVMAEPDLGVGLVFGAIAFGMLAVSGVPKRWLGGIVGALVMAGVAMPLLGILHTYQLKRLTSFANSSADPSGTGYNAEQARITVGSGGVLGKGLFHGSQTLGGFVPEQHTDFIFTVVGEQLGFVGSAAVIGVLALILWRAMRIAVQAADMFGTLVAAGVVCWLAFQTFENIGMAIGIMPITGLPLPFVSYGGSATFANMAAVGLLQTVYLHRRGFE